jgi:hypothetical protein
VNQHRSGDPTSDRPQLVDTLKEIFVLGAPIGTPRLVSSPAISVTCCSFGRGPASVLIHTLLRLGAPQTSLGGFAARSEGVSKPSPLRGTERSNPAPSSGESSKLSFASPMSMGRAGTVLLLGRFDRDKPHARPAHRLADRRGVRCVGLVALDVHLDTATTRHLLAEASFLERRSSIGHWSWQNSLMS